MAAVSDVIHPTEASEAPHRRLQAETTLIQRTPRLRHITAEEVLITILEKTTTIVTKTIWPVIALTTPTVPVEAMRADTAVQRYAC